MLLTIITITKNDFEGLEKTLKSTQNLREEYSVEHLIIDSSESSIQTKIKLFSEQVNTKYFFQKPQGISAAFNYGLSKAEGRWVWFLNSGDKLHSDLNIDLFIQILQNSLAKVIIFDIEYEKNKFSQRPSLPYLWPPVFNWISHPGTIINKNLLQQVKGFDEDFKIAMDGELWLRLLSQDIRTDLVSIVITDFQEGGLSSNLSNTALEVKKIIATHKFLLLKHWLLNGLMIIKAWIAYTKISKRS
ncbi:hypothetical protein C7H19_12330 [Aphanothece hegewaldii CCALA 016]|uniref:Glycosyltransferase 2-like domain-containing protein n=1 Tax=Aphanothece hegewaldii CCALA 016 TaxID=2107694 RepID=A0A2T1LX31_9CHRO|nr:glycosyltransferase [Aphanothece hegewaldii]PSF36750.1 hypothetical protein C7H19_12330 [Aphanothece hegewaldii CCALA 016]